MKLEERIQLIILRVKKLKTQVKELKTELKIAKNKNNKLKEENDALKKINFELTEKFNITNIANQLNNGNGSSKELKRKIDKYIREVDTAIAVLKEIK